jgi:SH3 domain-binding glutamic acid-rich protein
MAKPAHRALFNASPGGGPSSSPLRGATSSSSSSSSAPAPAPSPSPAETKKSLRERREAEYDVSDELTGYGLQGVKVTDDDLLALVEELGLGGEEAGDLVKGLSDHHPTDKAKSKDEASAEEKLMARDHEEAGAAAGDVVEKATAAAETEVAETDAGAPTT